MATENLQIPDITANQDAKEVTANAAHNLQDRAQNNIVSIPISGDDSLSTTESRENGVVELTGTPGAFNLNMPDTNRRTLTIVNNTDGITTVRNSAAGGTGQPVIQVGRSATFHYDGTDFIDFSATYKPSLGYMALNLESLREIVSNDIDTTANHGGILTGDSVPMYNRLNDATDKAILIEYALSAANIEIQFPPTFMPPDLDETQDLTIHLLARMSGTTDTTNTIDVLVFDAIGDTEMGSATAALSDTLAELTVTIVAANISGHPLGFLNIGLLPTGTHTTDAMEIYAAWIEYQKKDV